MRQVAHMFYAMAFLMLWPAGAPMRGDGPAPSYRSLQRRFWTGQLRLTDSRAKAVFGRAHYEQLLRNLGQTRWGQTLGALGARQP